MKVFVLFSDFCVFWKSGKLNLFNFFIRTLLNRLHQLLLRGSFFKSELSVHSEVVVEGSLVGDVKIGGLAHPERGELGGVEREESAASKGKGVGSVDHHHLVVLRVIIGLHVKEYN